MKNKIKEYLEFCFSTDDPDSQEKIKWIDELSEDILEKYSGKGRHYHSIMHIVDFCENLKSFRKDDNFSHIFDDYKGEYALKNALFAAIFHDYSFSLAPLNRHEAKSAERAARVLSEYREKFGESDINVLLVINLILATEFKNREIPFDRNHNLTALFADCDVLHLSTKEGVEHSSNGVIKEIMDFYKLNYNLAEKLRTQFLSSIINKEIKIFRSKELQELNKLAYREISFYVYLSELVP